MSEINLRLKAEAMGKDLEKLSYEVQEQLNEAIRDVVNAGYGTVVGSAQLELHSTRQDYLSGLSLQELGENEYLILLEGKFPNALEEGFSGFDVREGMLNSKKNVGIGPRTGQPWVQKGAEGQRYAHVPFQHRPFSKEAKTADLSSAIRKLTALNRQGVEQKFTKLFTDTGGNPLEGKVAVVRKVKGFPELDRITKYQKIHKNEKTGAETVQSIYMTYRTVSDNGSEWQHPGFSGLHAFDNAERFIDQKVDEILNKLLK